MRTGAPPVSQQWERVQRSSFSPRGLDITERSAPHPSAGNSLWTFRFAAVSGQGGGADAPQPLPLSGSNPAAPEGLQYSKDLSEMIDVKANCHLGIPPGTDDERKTADACADARTISHSLEPFSTYWRDDSVFAPQLHQPHAFASRPEHCLFFQTDLVEIAESRAQVHASECSRIRAGLGHPGAIDSTRGATADRVAAHAERGRCSRAAAGSRSESTSFHRLFPDPCL